MKTTSIYTKATPLLKELWRLYQGKKSGSVENAIYFDNCDNEGNSGGFFACDDEEYNYTYEYFTEFTEEEFIKFMEFDKELVKKARQGWSDVPPELRDKVVDISPESDHQIVLKENDVVNRPSHYTDGKIEVIDFIEDKQLGFHLANSVKYISRAGKKDPTKTKEDLKKAIWYIERYIKTYIDEKATVNL